MSTPRTDLALAIARIAPLAEDTFLFELRDPQGRELPPFTAGAHLALRVPNGLTRKYSLCNDPAERDRYEIAVKREAAGHGGSCSLVDEARAGDAIAASAPHNSFELVEGPGPFVFIAGGIGVTPILSMLRHLESTGRTDYHLYYLCRSEAATAFGDVLRAPPFAPRVTVHHDGGDPGQAFDLWPVLEKPLKAHVYGCGPRPLLEAVRDMTGHWPPARIHFESFVDAAAAQTPADTAFQVRLAASGLTVEVPPGISILDSIRAAGVEAPSSCESGTCGTCKTRLVAGDPDHRDFVLADDEKSQFVMICVSRSHSPVLVIDR
jgi:phthalate 4,5-dioxygenase reductase subunit